MFSVKAVILNHGYGLSRWYNLIFPVVEQFNFVSAMKEQFEKKALEDFLNGKTAGFNAIFNLYYGEICYFCQKLTNNATEGEDIAIQAFATLFRLHGQFNTLSNIKAFLYITSRNSSLNHIRSIQRRRCHEKRIAETLHSEAFENDIMEAIIVKEIYEAVEDLPTECGRVFKLIYMYGMKTADVAKQLSITQSTVRNHKKHALDQLRLSLTNKELILFMAFYHFTYSLLVHFYSYAY